VTGRAGHPGTHPSVDEEIDRLHSRIAELEAERDAMEAFAAMAAHELVEPLVMTEAYAAMVSDRLDSGDEDEARTDLAALVRGVTRVRGLVESLLHDARAAGRGLDVLPVDTGAIVRDTLSLLEPEITARGARIDLGELPVVAAEGPLLAGVFSNLLVNALKFSPRNDAEIAIGARPERGEWRFWVESTGPEIAPAERERIFEPFLRGRDERRVRGAGLGLAICRRIVERHGGRIGVSPLPGGTGNRFFFTLPRE
jgi:signal transduction histidine kinase